jgi:hypothetical protein
MKGPGPGSVQLIMDPDPRGRKSKRILRIWSGIWNTDIFFNADGEQCSVVFALNVTDPASSVSVGEGCYTDPFPASRFRNNFCKDDSGLFSRFLQALHDSYFFVYDQETYAIELCLKTLPNYLALEVQDSSFFHE